MKKLKDSNHPPPPHTLSPNIALIHSIGHDRHCCSVGRDGTDAGDLRPTRVALQGFLPPFPR